MWKKILSLPPAAFVLGVWDDYCRIGADRSAAALSYFLILTLFPLLLCVNWFIGLFHLDLSELLHTLDQFLPTGAVAVLEDYVDYVSAGGRSVPLFLAGLFTILVSASAALRTLFQTMDELYGTENSRPLRRFLLSFLFSLLFLLTIYLSVVVIFTGDWFFRVLETRLPARLAELLPLESLAWLWRWLRYLLLFCAVLLLLLVIYRFGAPRSAVRNRTVFFSSLFTALAMAVCSMLFSWFIGMSSRFALVYGSLASLVILLIWLYFCGNILLLGTLAGRQAEAWLRRRTAFYREKK